MSKRRRLLRTWFREHVARNGFVCVKCDTDICAHTIYHREVFANGKRLEVERTHARPDCPDAYYMGN